MGMQVVNRNNVVAGVFLIGSILLAVAISFILSDIQDKFGSKKSYVFRFSTVIGVAGLESGAQVTFGGLNVGTVKSIHAHSEVDPESGIEVTVAHDVEVALRSDLVLHEDAFADLTLPMLGGVSTINIPSAGKGSFEGGPEDANTLLDEGEVLRGRFAPSILTQLGFSTEDAEKIRTTIENIKQVSANANKVTASFERMTTSLEPDFIGGVDDGKTTMENIRAFTDRLNGEAGWSGKVDGILTSTQTATDKISPAIDDAHGAIEDARSMIDENRPRVARILDNAEQTSERIRFDSMGKIDELLDKGTLALGSYKDVADNANNLIDINRPKINSTLDSTRDIGINGKLFVEEIRSQPWRLLNKPSKEDLEREPLYEAARAYAEAVSDLRVASEALDSAVSSASQGDSQANAIELARISRLIEEAYGRYEEAERGLLERLRQPDPSTMP